ncbi:MAG: M48 family metallopeptidase [Bacteriovoracaceae bacterium]
MVYTIFYFVGLLYNIWKFSREREEIKSALIHSKNLNEQLSILKHQFYVFVFECFFGVVAAMMVEDKHEDAVIAFILLVFLGITFFSFGFFQFYLSYLKKWTGLDLKSSFNDFIVKDFRIVFSLLLLPILSYSLISWAFSNGLKEWGNWWIIGAPIEIIFYSVMTIIFTVVAMLKLIPNREITEPEYLELIQPHLEKLGLEQMRLRWIEANMKNAFVVGLNLWKFNNQTMFIGKPLRDILSREEFEAVICHELAHIANNHIHKRVLALVKGFILVIVSLVLILATVFLLGALFYNEDLEHHTSMLIFFTMLGFVSVIVLNQILIFEEIRRHEYEADAYAVLELGTTVENLESSLRKLTEPKDIPDYVKQKTQVKSNRFTDFLKRVFSTHPSLDERMEMVKKKSHDQLPFNWYENHVSRVLNQARRMTTWKTVTSVLMVTFMMFGWMNYRFQESKEAWNYITENDPETIKSNPIIEEKINRPRWGLVGPSMMAAIVNKKDPDLIEYFLERGGKLDSTLSYLAASDPETFKTFFNRYSDEIDQKQYYKMLNRAAQYNTENYRFLVLDNRFGQLDAEDRKKINSSLEYRRHRAPASVKPSSK